jgi:hypothetical protein
VAGSSPYNKPPNNREEDFGRTKHQACRPHCQASSCSRSCRRNRNSRRSPSCHRRSELMFCLHSSVRSAAIRANETGLACIESSSMRACACNLHWENVSSLFYMARHIRKHAFTSHQHHIVAKSKRQFSKRKLPIKDSNFKIQRFKTCGRTKHQACRPHRQASTSSRTCRRNRNSRRPPSRHRRSAKQSRHTDFRGDGCRYCETAS